MVVIHDVILVMQISEVIYVIHDEQWWNDENVLLIQRNQSFQILPGYI